MSSIKDSEQDRQISENSARIARNEEAIKRQTEALEKIRDHFYPRTGVCKRIVRFFMKVVCVIVAYLGIAETVDWLWNTRKSEAMAKRCAKVALRLFFEEGNSAGAAKFYEKASELDPNVVEYRMTLSFMKGMSMGADLITAERELTREELASVDDALAEASMLKEMEPKSPMAYMLMAQSLMLKGDSELAVAEVDRAVALAPENGSVRTSACAINYFLGRVDAARAHLAVAECLDATRPLVLLWKGMLAMAARDMVSARASFEALVKRAPRLAVGHVMIGLVMLEDAKPDFDGAKARFQRALALDPNQKDALIGMAQVYDRIDKPVMAQLWLDKVLSVDGNCLAALVFRARISDKLHDLDAAVCYLSQAIALAPFRADLYKLRAVAYVKNGEAELAASDLKTADALVADKRAGACVRPENRRGGQ